MSTHITATAHRFIERVRQVRSELDYAQRRSVELQTGIPMLRPEQRLRTGRPR